jgi:hypothetical protein
MHPRRCGLVIELDVHTVRQLTDNNAIQSAAQETLHFASLRYTSVKRCTLPPNMEPDQDAMRRPLLPVQKTSSRKWSLSKAGLLLALLAVLAYASTTKAPVDIPKDDLNGTFTIANDRFVRDGTPVQIISGRQVTCASVCLCM